MNLAQIEVQLAREGLAAYDMEGAAYAPFEGSSIRLGDEGEFDIFDQMEGGEDLTHLIEGLSYEDSLKLLDRLGIDYSMYLACAEFDTAVTEEVPSNSYKSLFKR
jgi:hypothetical protein